VAQFTKRQEDFKAFGNVKLLDFWTTLKRGRGFNYVYQNGLDSLVRMRCTHHGNA
jgi:hypothetical protein